MALTIIKEDGTGKVDANSYANVADGDAYFDGHLYATAWTAATTGNKEKALVFATRLIDSQFQFNGWRSHDNQALQWPRERCPDPDKGLITISILLPFMGSFVDADFIPSPDLIDQVLGYFDDPEVALMLPALAPLLSSRMT